MADRAGETRYPLAVPAAAAGRGEERMEGSTRLVGFGQRAELEGVIETCGRLLEVGEGTPVGPPYDALGPHLRHCLDHLRCLLGGLDRGLVDYDARERDARLERDPSRFVVALTATAADLAALDPKTLDAPLRVRQTAAPGRPPVETGSTLARELVFLSSHVVHHLEIMRRIAASHGIEVPERVALAFSTAAHRERIAAPRA